MAGASVSYHEPEDLLSEKTKDMHRALVSVQEELEAVDWYRQRADATQDEELKGLLLHNMREEIEHAAMLLEWLRRHEPHADLMFRTYLFTQAPVTEIEEAAEGKATGITETKTASLGLTVGRLKGG